MSLHFRLATPADAVLIGTLVIELTEEICARTGARHFSIDTDSTIRQSHQLMSAGHYAVILGFEQDEAIAMAATSTTWALYAGGKVGVIQEFYVRPQARSGGIGARCCNRCGTTASSNNGPALNSARRRCRSLNAPSASIRTTD